MSKDKNNTLNPFVLSVVSKTISEAISSVFIAPINRISILLQCQGSSTQLDSTTRYKDGMDWFRRVYKEQGIMSFYR